MINKVLRLPTRRRRSAGGPARTLFLIVVDQLKWSDRAALTALKKLGDPHLVDISSLPTVTETAHATMAVASDSSVHGVIGGEALSWNLSDNSVRHLRVDDGVFTPGGFGTGQPLIRTLARSGVQCFVLSGKDKVARLLDPRGIPAGPGASTRITFLSGREFELEGLTEEGAGLSQFDFPEVPTVKNLVDPMLDTALFELARLTYRTARDKDRAAFFFLGLPRLDALGHRYSRTAKEFRAAVSSLNDHLYAFLDELSDDDGLRVIVTGDHGCRAVDRTVVFSSTGQALEVWADSPNGPVCETAIKLPIDLLMEYDDPTIILPRPLPAIMFDGGSARFWVRAGRIPDVVAWLKREGGAYFSDVEDRSTRGAAHDNWGDVIAWAAPNVALCKHGWIYRKLQPNPTPSLVVGEHGTREADDREVPCWGHQSDHSTLLHEAVSFLS